MEDEVACWRRGMEGVDAGSAQSYSRLYMWPFLKPARKMFYDGGNELFRILL